MNKQEIENSRIVNPRACPVCGDANNVDFGELNQSSDDRMYIDCKCNNCGSTWKSWYNIVFNRSSIGLVFDKNDDIKKGTK